MTIPYCYIGCDISKAHLDIFDPHTGRASQVLNTQAAIKLALKRYTERPVLFVFEATGHYDRTLRHALADAGISGHRANPARVKQFGRATGKRAKTDVIDARLLSQFGDRLTVPADPPPCWQTEQLQALNTRRDQLVNLRSCEKNHREKTNDPAIRRSIETLLLLLDEQIREMEDHIAACVRADARMTRKAELLKTVPGVGNVTSWVLLAGLHELGHATPKQIAALAGLAPFNHDSGLFKGKRRISGGRARVRKAMFMAAQSAVRHCPRYRAFYQNLCERVPAKKSP